MQRKNTSKNGILRWPSTASLLSFLATGFSVQNAYAGDLLYGIGYYFESSDNIQRVPFNSIDDVTNTAFAGVMYRENGPTLAAHLQAQAEYRDYKYDTYNDGPLYYADASLLWRISPQQLHWVLVDRYDQVTRDITLPSTPDNLVNSNVLSTGPDIFLRLGQGNTLAIELRYGDATYSDLDTDNNRYGASVRWLYAVNTELTYSLNYQVEQVDYENEILNDNSLKQDFFIRVERRQARARFLLDLGATQIERDQAGEASGPLAHLTWVQQLTSESSAGILLASEYLDAGTALLSTATSPTPAPGDPPLSTATGELTSDLYYQKRAEVFYTLGSGNYGLNLRAYYRDIDYEIAPQDRQEAGGRIEIAYNPSSVLTTTVYGSHLDTQYQTIIRDDRENEAGIRFLYRVNSNVSATLEGRKTWRYSTDALQEYTDDRVLFSLLYSSSPLFIPVRR